MKRIVAVVAVLAATTSTSIAGAGRDRVIERSYAGAGGVNVSGEAEAHVDESKMPPPTFRSRPGETRVTVSIEDVTGRTVRGHVHVDANADGVFERVLDFCDETARPIALRHARATVTVAPLVGACDDGAPSTPTAGTVTATFSG